MPANTTRRIYMLIRTVSNSDIKPEIKTACKTLPYSPTPLDSTYDWSEAEATGNTTVWTLWAGIPHNSDASCRILNCSDIGGELSRDMVEDITKDVFKVMVLGDRFGELYWGSGEESSWQEIHAYMIRGDTDDIFHDDEDDGEEHIWWNIVYVDAPAS